MIEGLCSLLNRPNKADAFARDRADQPLLVAIVAQCAAGGIDAAGERG